MGNNIIQSEPEVETRHEPLVLKPEQQYTYVSQRKANIVGGPRIVRSSITGKQLQEYFVTNPEAAIQNQIKLYKQRSSTLSNNIAIVFFHKLVDQSEKLFMVRIQKMKGRLNQIQGLNILEGLVLLEASLNGFGELVYHTKIPFVISEKMIGINENSQVRVWANQNFALNRISPGINVRNQNIMIHQLFSAITQHIAIEERQAFSDIRFKIAKCQRVVEAKHIVSMMLQNTNRKIVIQQLVEKQAAKMARNLNQPVTMNHHNNFTPVPPNPVNNSNIKIPMNMSFPHQPQNGIIPVALTPQSPFVSNAEPMPVDRIQIMTQEYIKDDEGSDRIRMVRQEHNPSRLNSPAAQSFQVLHKHTNSKDLTSEFVSQDQNSNPVVVSIASTQNFINRQQKVSSNPPQMKTNYKPRTANIIQIKNRSKTEQNIDINGRSPLARSPLKSKPIFPEPMNNETKLLATAALNNKIALSENKITQMEKKISRLKQQFSTRNAERKVSAPFNGMVTQPIQERARLAVTPPHANINRSPMNQEIRPMTRYQNGTKLKSETTVGQTAAKWDRKLNQIIGRKTPTKYTQDRKQLNKTARNSEEPQMKKSMLAVQANNKVPTNGPFNGQVYQQPPKVQINFNGNPFINNGYNGLAQNKSAIMIKNGHF